MLAVRQVPECGQVYAVKLMSSGVLDMNVVPLGCRVVSSWVLVAHVVILIVVCWWLL